MSSFFQRYLMPGFVFQSVIIGGGYATGRELAEFFVPAGPWGGLLGMAVTACIWSVVLASCFELARLTRAFDYRSFFGELLGPGWVLYELAYWALLVLVLSVLGAACGEIAYESLGWPRLAGTLALMGAIGLIVFYGNATVEKLLSGWGMIHFALYLVFVGWCIALFGGAIADHFANEPVRSGWALGGLRYAGYNIACVPSVLFCLRHMTRRREAVTAGLLAGPITMAPGVVFYVAMMGYYPQIGAQPVPSNFLLAELHAPWFQWLFQLTILISLVATGTGLLHAINERVAKIYADRGRPMPGQLRTAIAVGLMVLSVFAATAFGLVGLIAQGYGAMTWVFLALVVVPALTVGIAKIRRLSSAGIAAA